MNKKILHTAVIVAITTFAVTTTSYAEIPNTFTAGTPATAADVNANFSAVDSRVSTLESTASSQVTNIGNVDTRVAALETTATTQASDNDFNGYYLPFAAAGEAKNVIVLRRTNSDGTVTYQARVRHSSGQTISVNGTPTARTHIASYVWAPASSIGSTVATDASDYIESPETTNYVDFLVEDSHIDLNNGNLKTVNTNGDVERWIDQSSSGTNGLRSVGPIRVEINDVFNRYTHYSSQYIGKLPTSTIEGITYNDVAVQQRLGGGHSRLRAKGIGTIFQIQNGQPTRAAVYYRVNGQTGGSLSGTPFEPGVGNLDGLFF